jgi:hypothetical protein
MIERINQLRIVCQYLAPKLSQGMCATMGRPMRLHSYRYNQRVNNLHDT